MSDYRRTCPKDTPTSDLRVNLSLKIPRDNALSEDVPISIVTIARESCSKSDAPERVTLEMKERDC